MAFFFLKAIDSYGRWGESYKEHLKNWCKQAAGQHHGLYNTLITRARDWIAVANARAIGNRVALGLSRCLPEASLFTWLQMLRFLLCRVTINLEGILILP